MTLYSALSCQARERMPGNSSQFRCLPKTQNPLAIERKGKLSPYARFHLRFRQPQAAGDGLRDVKMQGHWDRLNLT